MPDYRSMYDRDYIGHWDLPKGKDVIVTIREVRAGTLTSQGNRKTKKPVIYFVGKEKGMALNKTNGKAIAGMYGPETKAWAGKQIALYATTTQFGSETVDCIRVRPQVPTKRNGKTVEMPPDEPTEGEAREPGADDAGEGAADGPA